MLMTLTVLTDALQINDPQIVDPITITAEHPLAATAWPAHVDEDVSSPSTVCSVVTTTTVAQTPQLKLQLTAVSPMLSRSMSPQHDEFSSETCADVANGVGRCIAALAHIQDMWLPTKSPETNKKKPPTLFNGVFAVAMSLLTARCTTAGELAMACVLIKRALRGEFNPLGLIISSVNARRVLIAAVRLCAKAHSDEYYAIPTMCAAAGQPQSEYFFSIMAECEWKLFVALDMNCFVTQSELDGLPL
jgi:hypothetical protein